ncbi:CinA family nicotinamide mononucleotide deamidase-related protein [Spongiibacter sp. KMU-158]|uniref:CinA-like protein n=1 Tax=Spongiibacter pelagi TaxID=2760804 RepID=A0A927GW78_9GAMM|nr:CinA family nicotinamide mononucleotide deamidase-related protein [Spongiibacter pelagi]MBD2859160.1 CinA family nicotinamide mononucleotide deamidase-related protein [Spongiibacter pelagi]
MKINLLLTGNELMAGDTIDSNSSMIANQFAPLGWRLHKKVTVGDDIKLLCEEIDLLSRDTDVLIINGGLGPTVDDLTADALAKVSGNPLEQHPEALEHLQQWAQQRGYQLNKANLKQSFLPKGSAIIPNATGSAVGINLQHQGCIIIATPGVPSELRPMLSQQIIPFLQSRYASGYIKTVRIGVFGLGESTLQEMFDHAFPDWPETIELGFRASFPVLEVKLTARLAGMDEQLESWKNKVKALLAEHVLGEMPCTMAAACLQQLNDKRSNMVTAESCTGGLIASEITRIPGSSSRFLGGIVSYSNSMKAEVLGVSWKALEQEGAVSEVVAQQMLSGALRVSGADVGIAVTGIAGPDGGTEDKPVGTVWLAWGAADNIKTLCLRLPFERPFFQNMVTALGLDLLRRYLLGVDTLPATASRYKVS